MPRTEVAAIALLATACLVWFVGAFIGAVSDLRVLTAGVVAAGFAAYPAILVFGAIPNGGCG